MQHHDAQRAFEPVIFLLAHVVDLLGDRDRIDLRKPAGPQKVSLTHCPRIEVVPLRRGSVLCPNNVPGHSPVSSNPSAQSDVQRTLRQFLTKAALIELGNQGPLELVAFVEEGQAESKT